MTVDLLVQMLTALLSYAEGMRLRGGIMSEGLQFTAILTSADHLHVLPPVRGRFRRLLAAAQQELGGMTAQALELLIAEDGIAVALAQELESRHNQSGGVKHLGICGN